MEQTISEIVVKQKPSKILVKIHNSDGKAYASDLRQEVNTTYSHAVKVISKLKDKNLIKEERDGRKKLLSTTENGAELAEKLAGIINEPRYNEK